MLVLQYDDDEFLNTVLKDSFHIHNFEHYL